jgi:hypothetical protein
LSTASCVAAKELVVNELKFVVAAGTGCWDFDLHVALLLCRLYYN